MSFNHKTIEELHDLLVAKEISATELTQATLEDIKSREEAVGSFITVSEEVALKQAAAIDAKGIDADNLMSGIPLAVKDNISTKGILTTAASKMLYNYEPIFDATSVANAYAKDMIVIGKPTWTNLPWVVQQKPLISRKRKMLGTTQKYLVAHQVVRQQQSLQDKSVYLLVQTLVVLFGSQLHLMVLSV